MESAFVPTPSQTPTLADDLKNFYRRGVSGTAKAQNKQEIIEERAKQAGIMDATGKITDTEKYNALDEQVNRELEETGDAAPAANTRLFATSGTTSNNGNQQTYSVAGARKTLAGSNTIGALVTAKGLTSEDFRFMSLQEKGKEGGVSENVLNNFLAERISSGSLLKSDTYRITDNQGNTYDISKSDYNKIKKLAGEGKVDEIDKILQPYVEAAARDTGPTRAMFESDQAQRDREDAFKDRSPVLKKSLPADASARQQAEIEAGNVVPEPTQPQRVPKHSREYNRIQQMKERMKERAQKVRDTAESLGLDPNKVTGRFEGGKLTGIIDETGKQIDVSDRLSEEDKKSVNAARSMRAAIQGTQQSAPQVEPAKPESSTAKDEETGPVSGMEAGIMRAEGLDPESEFDRKLYRHRRETERAQAATRANATGAELNQMSVQNNDLQRQGNAPSSQPIVIQNNSAPSTQTTVTPPAQPRVDSSFSRVMDIRNFWD
jgi:hypothetical protein